MNNFSETTTHKSKFRQFIQWNWSDDIDPKIAMTRAISTWIMLLMLYTCFQFLWQVVNQANNYQGPVYELYPSSASNPMISRISNWSITITRGIVAIGLGLLITKIGHKKAVIFAVGMILLSFPALLTPMMKESMINNSGMSINSASQTSYGLFIVFRIFLAIGGTTINILQAPLIAKFFISKKQKNTAVKINNVPAQVAGILASLIFIGAISQTLTHAATESLGQILMSQKWILISGVVLGIVFAILMVYLFVGMHFTLKTNQQDKKELRDADSKKNSLGFLLKQPKVIFFTLSMVFLMYAGVEPGSGVLSSFWKTTHNNISLTWNLTIGMTTSSTIVSDTMLIWQILYTSSIFIALFTVMKWSNTKYALSRYCGVMTILGCSLWGVSLGIGAIGLGNPSVQVMCILTGAFGSVFIFGAQSMMYIVPYRWGLTNAQLTNFTGFLWTSMYVGYSLLDIITSFAGSGGVAANLGTVADYIANHTNEYVSLFNNTSSPEAMSKAYGTIKNILLGANVPTNLNELINPSKLAEILKTQSLTESISNLNNQYIGQIILIPAFPCIAGVLLFFVKKEDSEYPFSFKDFKQNHMHFNNTKKLINKLFKTNLQLQNIE